MTAGNDIKKVVLGLSGGVDSAVAAHLLIEDGYEVYAVFLKNWTEKDDRGACPAERDREDAMRVAAKLGIPFTTVDYESEYRERVFAPLLDGLSRGRTPNPDILCNPLIKFEALCATADRIGAAYIATGHYARARDGRLLAGLDREKDQSYFLSRITGEQLARSLFPVGDLTKPQVRALARTLGLHVAGKESTSGICFIGERDFGSFMKGRVPAAPGPVVTMGGERIADHRGLAFYTVGQRHGFGGGGGSAYYVAEKRLDTNTLVVAPAYDPSLFRDEASLVEPHWISGTPRLPLRCKARIRYRQPLQECIVSTTNEPCLMIRFSDPQRAVTPGQYAAFYDGEALLGSAMIADARSIIHAS
jgi:tRNA-specific 2-thiouridylase